MGSRGRHVTKKSKVRRVVGVLLLVVLPAVLAAPSMSETDESILPKDLGLEETPPESTANDELRKYWNWPFSIQYQAPQVQIRLVDSLIAPPGGWAALNHPKYTTKRDTRYYYDANEVPEEDRFEEPTYEDKPVNPQELPKYSKKEIKENQDGQEEAKPLEDPPVIASRNIITAPSICAVGQRRDSRGICRTIIQM